MSDLVRPKLPISSEDRDNFVENILTIRAEERVALAARVPQAFVFIDELGEGFSG